MPETSLDTAISNPNIAGISSVNPVAAAPAHATRPLRKPVEAKSGWWWGTGRRKTAVARVRLRPRTDGAPADATNPGAGTIRVQIDKDAFKTVEQYFSEDRDRADCYAPLKVSGMLGRMEVVVRLNGGGFMGQAGAAKLGIARALRDYDPQLEQSLRDNGLLTRDDRDVERKKYGQAGARRRFQFSKR